MTWTKIDDQLHAHPKVVRAWHAHPRSLGLHLLALSHCAAYLTDGHIDEAWVKSQVPSSAQRRGAVNALVSAGLWDVNGSGWVIHDYLDFNESRADVLARHPSRTRAQAGAQARTRAGAGGRGPTPSPFRSPTVLEGSQGPAGTRGERQKGNGS